VDTSHGIASGTSFAAPMVAGAVALLLQRDPTLTSDAIIPLLQGGAHRIRGAIRHREQAGPGELDVLGALDALSQRTNSTERLPDRAQSWVAASADYAAADGAPFHVFVQLRTADGRSADAFDPARLTPLVKFGDEVQLGVPTEHPAPGLWTYAVYARGRGGQRLTVGARFDGTDIVDPLAVPIATDPWTARYSSSVGGGCSSVPSRGWSLAAGLLMAGCAAAVVARRRRKNR